MATAARVTYPAALQRILLDAPLLAAGLLTDGNKRVAQLMANKVLIENDVGIFRISIEKLEEFKGMLIEFYETGDDVNIIGFMKEYCIRKVRG